MTDKKSLLHSRRELKPLRKRKRNKMEIKKGKTFELLQRKYLLFSVLFLFVIVVGYSPVYLSGKSLIWNIDGIGQYYPAFLYIGQYLRNALSGGGIPSYDLSIAMGENIVGCLNYYGFGDPINLFAIFATEDNGYIVFAVTFFLRVYLSGFAMIYYLDTINVGKHGRVITALAYCFTGFTLFGGTYYIEWLSALILLPLMLAEAERFITKQKSKQIIFSLVICYGALCGFYFLYMTSLALAMYCVVRIIAVNGKFDIKNLFETCFKLLGWYLLGIGLSAPFLFQALDGYFFSERNSQEINAITSISGYIPSIVSLVNFGEFSVNPRGYRYEFGITIFHWAATIYIFIKAITQRGKRDIQLGIGILLSVITVALPIFGYLFNGFGETNTRWYFLIEFLATVILAVVIDEVYNSSQRLKKIYKYACILIVLNISANVLMVYSSFGSDLSNELIATSEVKEYTSSPVKYFSELTDDNGVYRIDHDLYTETNGRPDNIAMLNGYKGLSYWFSIINQNSQNYADFSAGKNLKHRSFGFGKNAYTSALVGTKYYCAKADNQELENNFTLLETIEFNRETWKLYKNNLYKGIVYECDRSEEYSLGIDGDFEKYNKSLYECIDSSNISNVSYSSNRDEISFSTVNNDKSTYNVAIMIPYHWAWKATINGEKTQVSKFNGMMSIEVPKGEHEIKLTYSPVVRNTGIIVFFISIMAAILCCALSKEMRNRDLVKSRGSAMAEVAGHATHEVPYL